MTGPSTRWYKVSFRGGPGFFSGKPAGGRTPVLAFIQKGAAAPGMGCYIVSVPRPTGPRGPRAPLLYGRRFRKKRQCRFSCIENRPISWGSGGKALGVSLYPFSTRRKDWPHIQHPFRQDAAWYARTYRNIVWPEGHLLSSHEERRQRRAKGESPLESRAILIFRAIVGHHNGG